MSEEANNVEAGQQDQTGTTGVEPDYKKLYLEEVQNAKKQRNKRQEVESQMSEAMKEQETQKVKTLKEQEKFKELYEQTQAKLDSVAPYKDKWESYESNRRTALLEQLPEDDRERLSSESISTLEYIVSKVADSKPENPSPVPSSSDRNSITQNSKDWTELDEKGRRENWSNIVQSYKK